MAFCKLTLTIFLAYFMLNKSSALPSQKIHSFVVSAKTPHYRKESLSENRHPNSPEIYEMFVKSSVSNRYAYTTVVSKVKNLNGRAQETTFAVILPDSAFISGFIMEIDGKNYTAYVKEKEEAQRTYNEAVAGGQGAAHVALSARDSNRFTVSVNIEPQTKAAFYLNYEELLQRQDNHYELVINLHPGQPVADLSVEVLLAESRKITNLKALPIRSGNEIECDKIELDPKAYIEYVTDTSAVVRFIPNMERQKYLAHHLGTKEDDGLAGQFVVQYEVESDPNGGEVLIQNGYFVHFFAPTHLPALPKHVVFILDTSGSMHNRKIQQLKEAMHRILEELNGHDVFHLVEFNTNVKVWDLDNPASSASYPVTNNNNPSWLFQGDVNDNYESIQFPNAYQATGDNIRKAKTTVSRFAARGSTDIYNSLKIGLHLVELTVQNENNINHQPMIIFLTDGDPTVRLTNTEEITQKVTEYNSGIRKSSIFALSFGNDADRKFLQKLSLRNAGFSKHIYEAADASLQLQNFYKQISSPLLANVIFKYQSSASSLTVTEFPMHFKGSELVVAGKYYGDDNDFEEPIVQGSNGQKTISLRPTVQRSVTSIERLWAYLTVKQLLDKKEVSDDFKAQLKKKALDLSLQYSFVTSVSSLVVVKPDTINTVDTVEAAEISGPSTIYHKRIATSPHTAAGMSGPRPHTDVLEVRIAGDGYNHRAFPTVHHTSITVSRGCNSLAHCNTDNVYQLQSFTPDQQPPLLPYFPATTTTETVPDILTLLPWLNDVLYETDTISLLPGNYKLGLNETITDNISCPKTPLNKPGHCKLLNSCSHVYPLLTSIDVFTQHFCLLRNRYAGICCPNSL